jgi:hypothetical protein
MNATVKFKVKHPIYWDNWGRPDKAFNMGDVVIGKGTLSGDGETVLDVTAESTLHEGIEDDVDMSRIEIIEVIKIPVPEER